MKRVQVYTIARPCCYFATCPSPFGPLHHDSTTRNRGTAAAVLVSIYSAGRVLPVVIAYL